MSEKLLNRSESYPAAGRWFANESLLHLGRFSRHSYATRLVENGSHRMREGESHRDEGSRVQRRDSRARPREGERQGRSN
jgi:hypothetical protein